MQILLQAKKIVTMPTITYHIDFMKKSTLKKIFFSVATMIFATTMASAQDVEAVPVDTVAVEVVPVDTPVPAKAVSVSAEKKGPDAQQAARAISNQMKEHLILNDAQNMKVYIINLDFLKKTFENNKNADKAERNKRQRGLEEERDAKLKSVLNEKQFKVFIANRPTDRKRIIPYYE